MHTLAVQLTPILGAEKNKVPFYIAGGLLVSWALFLSLVLSRLRPDFPANLQGQRTVMAISVLLVLGAVSTAVITAGGKKNTAQAAATPQSPTPATTPSEPTPAGTSTQPSATTGTPAPPSSPAAPASTTLKLAANPAGQLAYNTKTLSAKAGTVTIEMANMSPVEHNVTIAQGTKVLGATPTFKGGTKTVTLSLKAGTYTFYCSVPGHRQAGMEGTLTIS